MNMTKTKQASARITDARISLKSSIILCKSIRNKRVVKSKALLEGLISGKRDINGKHYTKTARKILELLKNAESNAKVKMMDEDRLFVASAKADKGRTFIRPRTKASRRGERAKMTHLEILLEER
jgi:ribosomal protein L22